ncbi:MAG: osmotically-inducible protein OsmY [Rhodoferax sp.]|jgi:osmotically-inducible protein OsmY
MLKFSSKKFVSILLLTAVVGGGLVACAPVIIGGAVMTSLVATDRRTAGIQVEDEGIELRSATALRDYIGDRAHINVTSYNRQVLLTGEAPTEQDRQLAERVVTKIENVRSIVNEIAVLGNATLTQRTSDVLVTGRVKAGMIDARDVYTNAFKVVTERGTTYLMGRVSQREADRATEVARATSGVQKVVRVLEIISEEELKNIMPKPSANEVPL